SRCPWLGREQLAESLHRILPHELELSVDHSSRHRHGAKLCQWVPGVQVLETLGAADADLNVGLGRCVRLDMGNAIADGEAISGQAQLFVHKPHEWIKVIGVEGYPALTGLSVQLVRGRHCRVRIPC